MSALRARARQDWRAAHAAADAFEPRLARAIRVAVVRMRERCSIADLAAALADKDVRRALAVMTRTAPEDAFHPAGDIVRDAVVRGGKMAYDLLVPSERFSWDPSHMEMQGPGNDRFSWDPSHMEAA